MWRHTSEKDVEISSSVVIGRGENAEVRLHLFAENEHLTHSIVTSRGD
jgi:hypothetical protein